MGTQGGPNLGCIVDLITVASNCRRNLTDKVWMDGWMCTSLYGRKPSLREAITEKSHVSMDTFRTPLSNPPPPLHPQGSTDA